MKKLLCFATAAFLFGTIFNISALAQSRTYHKLQISQAGAADLENFLESNAANKKLDLMFVISNPGLFERTVSGLWRPKKNEVCVDFGFLYDEHLSKISLEFLGPSPPKINLSALPPYNTISTSTLYAALRSTPAQLSLPLHNFSSPTQERVTGTFSMTANGLDYMADLIAAAKMSLEKFLQSKVEVRAYNFRSGNGLYCNQRDLLLLPNYVLLGDPKNYQTLGYGQALYGPQISVIAILPISSLRTVRIERLEKSKERLRSRDDLLAKNDAILQKIEKTNRSGEGALYGALAIERPAQKLPSELSPRQPTAVDQSHWLNCIVQEDGEDAPRWGMQLQSFVLSDQFAVLVPQAPKTIPTRAYKSIDDLFSKAKQYTCTTIIGNGPQIAALYEAFKRDGFLVRISSFISEIQLAEFYAKMLGFTGTNEQTVVAAWEFSRQIGDAQPSEIEALRSLSVLGKKSYDAAMARYGASRLPFERSPKSLIAFLADEREANQKRISVEKLRTDREAAEMRARAEAEAASREAARRHAIEFPYFARVTCTSGGTDVAIQACMMGDSWTTQIELRNGDDYKMFQIQDIDQSGYSRNDGLEIDLRSRFSLTIKNASKLLILNLVIVRRSDGREIYRKSAAFLGVIDVHN